MAAVSHIPNPQSPGARPNGSAVTLRRQERGFVYGGDLLVARTFQVGTTATIFASETMPVQPWPDALQAGARSEFRYRVKIDLPETYVDFQQTGATIQTGRNGGLIPHSALSNVRGGKPLTRTEWKDGDIAYLLKTHSYIDSGGISSSIPLGEAVVVRSGPRTLRPPYSTTSIPSMAHYSFQRVTETTRNKIWLSVDRIHEAYL